MNDQDGAIHDHRRFTVKRRRVQYAVVGQAARHRRQNVGRFVFRGQIVQRNQPAVRAPDRGFVHADGHDVESAALGADVRRDALTQDILFQRHPFHLMTRLRGEIIGQTLLHADHVAVVHGGDGDGDGRRVRVGIDRSRRQRDRGRQTKSPLELHPNSLPWLWISKEDYRVRYARKFLRPVTRTLS